LRAVRAQMQGSMRPVLVVVPRTLGEDAGQVPLPEDQRSVTSVRMVKTRRSAKQFARGERSRTAVAAAESLPGVRHGRE
jgi:hypothetical protein